MSLLTVYIDFALSHRPYSVENMSAILGAASTRHTRGGQTSRFQSDLVQTGAEKQLFAPLLFALCGIRAGIRASWACQASKGRGVATHMCSTLYADAIRYCRSELSDAKGLELRLKAAGGRGPSEMPGSERGRRGKRLKPHNLICGITAMMASHRARAAK